MYKIICNNCSKETTFSDMSNRQEECPFCYDKYDASSKIIEIKNELAITGLTLTYQKDLQKIEIPAGGKIILGRNGYGSQILSKILFNDKPVISGTHFSMEFINGYFYLRDEGSSNGTFYGINKQKCSGSPLLIENNSIIYLGREPFVVQFKFDEPCKMVDKSIVEEVTITSQSKVYKCNECGFVSDKKEKACPQCSTYNSFIEQNK